jgi:hypothetical protein
VQVRKRAVPVFVALGALKTTCRYLVRLTEIAMPVFIDLQPNGLALEFGVPVGFVFPDPELDAGGRLKILM